MRFNQVICALVGVFVLFLAACSSGTNAPAKVPVGPSSMFYERLHHFCSDHIEDRFLIGYFGDEALDTTIYFFIVSHTGDTIYRDSWRATEFLKDCPAAAEDKVQRRTFLQKKMQDLVEGKTGKGAVVKESESESDPDFGPMFTYAVNEERVRNIHFSRVRKSVALVIL